jgi:hypothetical protein
MMSERLGKRRVFLTFESILKLQECQAKLLILSAIVSFLIPPAFESRSKELTYFSNSSHYQPSECSQGGFGRIGTTRGLAKAELETLLPNHEPVPDQIPSATHLQYWLNFGQ